MFGSKKTATFAGEIETIIGKDTVMKGSIGGQGNIRIDGQFEGEINTTGNITVGDGAVVRAQVKARNAHIAGRIDGNMEISEKLELLATGQLYGDLTAGVLSIAEGAIFRGACGMNQQGVAVPQAAAAVTVQKEQKENKEQKGK